MFVVTAALLWRTTREGFSWFAYWYTLALGLMATGIFGVMIEPSHSCALTWVGRSAQYLSGVYMLAAVASVREVLRVGPAAGGGVAPE